MRFAGFVAALLAAVAVLAACAEGSDVRHVHITIEETGCRPAYVEVEPARTAHLQIQNDSTQIYRITDDDERLEPLMIQPQAEGEAFYELPQGVGEYSIRCTAADGTASTVTLRAGTAAATQDAADAATGTPADQTGAALAVTLVEYSVTPSEDAIEAGRVSIIATNISSTMRHELNVLRVEPDGSMERVASIDPIEPQQGGAAIVDLEPGTYRLACLIRIGEGESTVDHYQRGMWSDLTVE